MATEPMSADGLCDHAWGYNKPAHATASVRICSFCHTVDGEDLMRTLNEYALEQMTRLKQKPTTLLYAWTDGQTFSVVDEASGIPDNRRERAILRGLLTHTLAALDEYDSGLHLHTAPADFR